MSFEKKTKRTRSEDPLKKLQKKINQLEAQHITLDEKNRFLLYRLGKLRSELVQNDSVTSDLKDRLTKFIDSTFNDYSENY